VRRPCGHPAPAADRGASLLGVIRREMRTAAAVAIVEGRGDERGVLRVPR
jgi:hypothetical protein